MKTYQGTVALTAALALSACGVNPDHMQNLSDDNDDVAEQSSNRFELPPLEASDGDPASIRQAIAMLPELTKLLVGEEYAAYKQRRYALLDLVKFQIPEAVATNKKTPEIYERLEMLDAEVGRRIGGRAQTLLDAEEYNGSTSVDALFAITAGVDECARALTAPDDATAESLFSAFSSSISRAESLAPEALRYVGTKPSGSGHLDVPMEIAACEGLMALRKRDAEDRPPVAQSQAREYEGCGSWTVQLEASQESKKRFGPMQLVGRMISADEAPPASGVECSKIPPVSDAPAEVSDALRGQFNWLTEDDVVTLAGPFEYDDRAGVVVRKATVVIYRQNATMKTTACGEQNAAIVCEASGSPVAKAINHSKHYLGRAQVHKTSGRKAQCATALSKAASAAKEGLQALTTADPANRYKSTDGVLERDQAQTLLEKSADQAKTQKAKGWCKS